MSSRQYDIHSVRKEFPYLDSISPRICYLDNAATSQKPAAVIEKTREAYQSLNANVHRGVYKLSEHATGAFEGTRKKLANFLGGVPTEEIVFTSGTTESINLVARTWGDANLKQGDEILLTVMEHHSNIVPWQLLAERTQAIIKYIPLDKDFRLDMEAAQKLMNTKTKILAFTHVSNVLGHVNPVHDLVSLAKKFGAISLIDGAQGAAHFSPNVKSIDCDFYCFGAHKTLGPTGVGLLYGKRALLESMPPFMGGGDMIRSVSLTGSTWNDLPYKFEAGTPAIAQVIGFGAAIDFLESLDREAALAHERKLGNKALNALRENPHLQLYTQGGDDWVGIVCFTHKVIHPHDLAAFQDSKNVCVRAGHHCAQPLMNILKTPATTRMSPYLYNTEEEVDLFLEALREAEQVFL